MMRTFLLLAVAVGTRSVADLLLFPLLLASAPSMRAVVLLEAPAYPYRKRVLLFRELVDEVPGITPKREVGAGGVVVGAVKGSGAAQALAVAVLLVEVLLAAPSRARRRGEGVEGDVGRLACTAVAGDVERNFGGVWRAGSELP